MTAEFIKAGPLVGSVQPNVPSHVKEAVESGERIVVELIRRLFVLVSPDTSIAHAATAMGTPIVDLMIGENIKIWDPIGVPNTIILSKDPFTLHQLPVDDVIKGFDKLIAQISS